MSERTDPFLRVGPTMTLDPRALGLLPPDAPRDTRRTVLRVTHVTDDTITFDAPRTPSPARLPGDHTGA